jgi:hypothetical protein
LKTKYLKHPDQITAEQKASHAKDAAEDMASMRFVCTLFRFWRVCTQKSCRRALRCSGDAHTCFARWWPHVPEQVKVQFRAKIKARCAGLSPREAVKAAKAEVARWRELEKRYGEPQAAAAPTDCADAPSRA